MMISKGLKIGSENRRRGGPANPSGPLFNGVPTLSGAGVIGDTLTVLYSVSGGKPPLTTSVRWLLAGSPIAGETEENYVPGPEEDGAVLAAEVTATDSLGRSVTMATAHVTAHFAAPVVVGPLPDVTYELGTGDQSIAAAAAFSGTVGGLWSVAGAGATIDASGTVTFPTDTEQSAVSVTVRYDNSGGGAEVSFALTVRDPAAVITAPEASGTLADLSLAAGVAMTPQDLSQGFSGTVDGYALAPTSESLPGGLVLSADGVLSGTPDAPVSARTAIVRASNSAGFADSSFEIAVYALDFEVSLTGLTDNATYGATAESSVQLTAAASGFTGPVPATLTYQWKTLESGPLPGATASTYTPDAAVNDGESLYCTVSGGAYPDRDSAAFVIRQVPPSVVGSIAAQGYRRGVDPGAVELSLAFGGAALSYALGSSSDALPEGRTLNAATGRLEGVPTEVTPSGAPRGIEVVAANSGGVSAPLAFTIDVTAPVLSNLVVTATEIAFDTDSPDGDVFWSCGSGQPSDAELLAGAGAGVEVAGTFPVQGNAVSGQVDLTSYAGQSKTITIMQRASDLALAVPLVTTQVIPATFPAPFEAGMWSVASGAGDAEIFVSISALPLNGGSPVTGVEYDLDGSGAWTGLPSYAGTGSYTITASAGGVSYAIRLRAVNAVGFANPGNSETVTSGSVSASAPAAMSPPTVSAVSQVDGEQLEVDLAPVTDDGGASVTRFDLRHSMDESNWTVVQDVASADQIISGLMANTLHYVQSRAVNSVGTGGWSGSATATTTVAAPVLSGVAMNRQDLLRGVAMAPLDASVLFSGTGLAYSLGAGADLPAGLVIDPSSAVITGAPTEPTEATDLPVVLVAASNEGGSVTDDDGITFSVGGPVIEIASVTSNDVAISTDDSTGTVYWAFCSILNPADSDLIAGSGPGILVSGNFAARAGGDSVDLTAEVGTSGYMVFLQVGTGGALSNKPSTELAVVSSGGSGISEPQLLAAYSTSSAGATHETPSFTPSGTGPVVVKVTTMNGVSASAPAAVGSADIGGAGRATGSGASASNSVTSNNGRTNTWIYVFTDPGASEITFAMGFAGDQRSIIVEVWEYPGSTSAQAGASGVANGSTATTLSPAVAGPQGDAIVAYVAGMAFENNTIAWTGVDAQGTNRHSNPGGSNTSDCTMRSAYENVSGVDPVSATASWPASSKAAAIAMEIEQ